MKMRILFVPHVGNTYGHLLRALPIAIEVKKLDKDIDIQFAIPTKANWLMDRYFTDIGYSNIRWEISHNDCKEENPDEDLLNNVLASNEDLEELIQFLKPDLIIGLPGIVTSQLSRKNNVKQISILHAPYLSPIINWKNMPNSDLKTLSFLNHIFSDNYIGMVFNFLSSKMDLPVLTYNQFLNEEDIYVPQPYLDLGKRNNIQQCSFIKASFGEDYDEKIPESSCLLSFGSGNPCDINVIIDVLKDIFDLVLFCTGSLKSFSHYSNVKPIKFISSKSLCGKVGSVISHGGMGTVGTFAEYNTKQLIIPTEPDQAVMAIYSKNINLTQTFGLEKWSNRKSQLGRSIDYLELNSMETKRKLQNAIINLKNQKFIDNIKSNGAKNIALNIVNKVNSLYIHSF